MSKQEKTMWITTDKRFVAFFDILGFKDLVMRNTHEEIYKLLSDVSEMRKEIETWKDESVGRYANSEIYTVSFSDSIVLFSKTDSIEDYDLFIYSVRWLFENSIKKTIPLKAAIAYGEISLNQTQQIYFGQPIIDAYLLEEELNYFGIVFHNTIEEYCIKNFEESSNKKACVEIMTPLKSGTISHLNLLWFDTKESKKEVILEAIAKFKNKVSGNPRKYIDNTIKVIEMIYGEK